MKDSEIQLLDALIAAHNGVKWALEYCEDGVMPMAGVNSLRVLLLDMKEAIDGYPAKG
jgi:hypothetical protein